MKHVVTLIDDPQRAQLQVRHVEAVCSALRSSGATPVDVDWLAEGVACDLPFSWPEQGDTASLEQDLRQALGDVSLDLAVQPAAGRRKRLLVADLESTIIQQEMLDELGELIGKREKIATITERSMRGELDRKSTRLNSSHVRISYAVFCLKKKNNECV